MLCIERDTSFDTRIIMYDVYYYRQREITGKIPIQHLQNIYA